jgi:hypothetical protein
VVLVINCLGLLQLFCLEERWALCSRNIEIASDEAPAPGFFLEVFGDLICLV